LSLFRDCKLVRGYSVTDLVEVKGKDEPYEEFGSLLACVLSSPERMEVVICKDLVAGAKGERGKRIVREAVARREFMFGRLVIGMDVSLCAGESKCLGLQT
jgi:hypothetical protein